jgi:hypothetical protein
MNSAASKEFGVRFLGFPFCRGGRKKLDFCKCSLVGID